MTKFIAWFKSPLHWVPIVFVALAVVAFAVF